jgi:hypothetical protein
MAQPEEVTHSKGFHLAKRKKNLPLTPVHFSPSILPMVFGEI